MADAYASFADGGVHHDVDRDLEGRVPRTATARSTLRAARGQAGAHRRGRLRGHPDPEDGRSIPEPPPATTSAAPRPVRRERPTSRPTPGSSATRRGSRPRSGSAIRTSRTSMGSSAFGGSYAAPVWQEYMLKAIGNYCGDFPEPQNPSGVELLQRHAASTEQQQQLELRHDHLAERDRDGQARHRHRQRRSGRLRLRPLRAGRRPGAASDSAGQRRLAGRRRRGRRRRQRRVSG